MCKDGIDGVGRCRSSATEAAAKCRTIDASSRSHRRAHRNLSLAPARTRVYLYVLSFGGFKPNPPRPQSALRRPPAPRPRRRRLSLAASTDSSAKLCPKSTSADVRRVLIATASGHRSGSARPTRAATSRSSAARTDARLALHTTHTYYHSTH